MRHSELWLRLEAHLGAEYAAFWARQQVMGSLAGRTAVEALDDGVDPLVVWRAVHAELELPHSER